MQMNTLKTKAILLITSLLLSYAQFSYAFSPKTDFALKIIDVLRYLAEGNDYKPNVKVLGEIAAAAANATYTNEKYRTALQMMPVPEEKNEIENTVCNAFKNSIISLIIGNETLLELINHPDKHNFDIVAGEVYARQNKAWETIMMSSVLLGGDLYSNSNEKQGVVYYISKDERKYLLQYINRFFGDRLKQRDQDLKKAKKDPTVTIDNVASSVYFFRKQIAHD